MLATTPSTDRWLCRKPIPRAPLRLFCFPYAGGGTMIYQKWTTAFQGFAEVFTAQLAGRERRLHETPFTRLADSIEDIFHPIIPLLNKPFVFFGHSMGALMSFELGRKLAREQGVEPLHLFVSGREAPQCERKEPYTFDLSEEEFVEDVRRLNGTPREILDNAELRQLLLPILRADFAVSQTYEYIPGPPLSCPLTVFGGLQDEVSRAELEGWREHTTSSFKLRMFPGDHFFVNTAQAMLLDVIGKDIYPYVHKLNQQR